MFGLGKAVDREVALDYCDLIGETRLKLLDDEIVVEILRTTLPKIGKKNKYLHEQILNHLKDHQIKLYEKYTCPQTLQEKGN